eukprot:Rmarinus@m.20003
MLSQASTLPPHLSHLQRQSRITGEDISALLPVPRGAKRFKHYVGQMKEDLENRAVDLVQVSKDLRLDMTKKSSALKDAINIAMKEEEEEQEFIFTKPHVAQVRHRPGQTQPTEKEEGPTAIPDGVVKPIVELEQRLNRTLASRASLEAYLQHMLSETSSVRTGSAASSSRRGSLVRQDSHLEPFLLKPRRTTSSNFDERGGNDTFESFLSVDAVEFKDDAADVDFGAPSPPPPQGLRMSPRNKSGDLRSRRSRLRASTEGNDETTSSENPKPVKSDLRRQPSGDMGYFASEVSAASEGAGEAHEGTPERSRGKNTREAREGKDTITVTGAG